MKKTLLAQVGLLVLTLISSTFAIGQNALSYDGTDDYVQTSFPGISGSSARTVEAWVRTTANCVPSSGGRQQIICDWGSMSTGQRSTFNILWGNSIRFEAGGNGLSGSTPINDGIWHHVAMTYDPLSTNQVKLYIDGQLEVQGNLTVPVNTATTTNFQIGMRVDGINHFTGDIDEVRVWNIARTQADIQADMGAEFCAPPAGLVVYYKANEGTAGGSNAGITTMPNSVSSNYDGTLMNFALNGNSSNWISGAGITSGGSSSSFQATGCNQYTAPSGAVFDSTGVYTDVIPNTAGCDSVMTIDLTITEVNVDVTDNGDNTLTADQAGATYQWLNCTQGFAYISGATGQTFTPTQNGQFAVEVTVNGCADSSSCYNITTIGEPELLEEQIELYPNPAAGRVNIRTHASTRIEIVNLQGKLIYDSKEINGTTTIDVSSWAKGVYWVRFRAEGITSTKRLIIQ